MTAMPLMDAIGEHDSAIIRTFALVLATLVRECFNVMVTAEGLALYPLVNFAHDLKNL